MCGENLPVPTLEQLEAAGQEPQHKNRSLQAAIRTYLGTQEGPIPLEQLRAQFGQDDRVTIVYLTSLEFL